MAAMFGSAIKMCNDALEGTINFLDRVAVNIEEEANLGQVIFDTYRSVRSGRRAGHHLSNRLTGPCSPRVSRRKVVAPTPAAPKEAVKCDAPTASSSVQRLAERLEPAPTPRTSPAPSSSGCASVKSFSSRRPCSRSSAGGISTGSRRRIIKMEVKSTIPSSRPRGQPTANMNQLFDLLGIKQPARQQRRRKWQMKRFQPKLATISESDEVIPASDSPAEQLAEKSAAAVPASPSSEARSPTASVGRRKGEDRVELVISRRSRNDDFKLQIKRHSSAGLEGAKPAAKRSVKDEMLWENRVELSSFSVCRSRA